MSAEKLLLTALVALAAVIWLLRVGRSSRPLWLEWRTAATTLATQQEWIDNRANIEVAAAKAIEHLDPARTFSSPRLLGELSTIADQVGVRANTASEIIGTDRTSLFSSTRCSSPCATPTGTRSSASTSSFHRRSPYIGIEQFSLTVNPSNPTLLNATLRVSSVEIVR